ncbi:MAG TPA: hypothetical protein VF753_10550 [Terriglobales bacterium]
MLTEASVNEGTVGVEQAGRVEAQPVRGKCSAAGCNIFVIHKGPNLGGVITTFVFFSTILGSLSLGILAAYGSVVGILRLLAPGTATPKPQPVLVQTRAHAATASGD